MRLGIARLLMALAGVLLLSAAADAQRFAGRHEVAIICCNVPVYDPSLEGVGTDRSIECRQHLASRSPDVRRGMCESLRRGNNVCREVGEACGNKYGKDCGGDPPTAPGFVFPDGSALHSEPSAGSATTSTTVNGGRYIFRDVRTVNGETWYYVQNPGGGSGWISSKNVGCTRPKAPPPSRPNKVVDSGVGVAKCAAAQTAGSRG